MMGQRWTAPELVAHIATATRRTAGGCWVWTGCVTDKGYGQTRFGGRTVYVHRFMYEQACGPIPKGLQIDHRCHNEDAECFAGRSCEHRRCCNPAHLTLATPLQNTRAGHQHTRQRAAG